MSRLPVTHRVRVDGKFFRAGDDRIPVRGIAYGAFAPNAAREPFPEPDRAVRDLDAIAELGANAVRVYDVPPRWLLDEGAARGLRFLVGVPWLEHTCFLDSRTTRRQARVAVTSAAQTLAGHPAVFALILGNEIPADIVRWSGSNRVSAFIDELAEACRQIDPGFLCTYANFPPTEFVRPGRLDFITFNVFLHSRPALAQYLARLQQIADNKPLLLGECGVDSGREGDARQAEILGWTLDTALRAGLAGSVVFTFTDEWHRGGAPVQDWHMGLTTADRQHRPAFAAVQSRFLALPGFPLRPARVSVVVAAYNAGATLEACLQSLLRLNHPDYEVIVVDDGSTDDTPLITANYPSVRTLRLTRNAGLSHARNLGVRAATGDIIAFTDADCRADPDWLRFLTAALEDLPVVGVGGPNLLPPDDPPMAAAVMAAPGGPVHVMFDDRFAEHIPGCNMAFWKWALEAVGGFDIAFERAGDDVDVCWRLQRRDWKLGFSPAAVVWHHRRSTIRDYLLQQAGYGEAEALLLAKHPAHFNALGAARWQGRICAPNESDRLLPWQKAVVFRGVFASGLFQTLYTPAGDNVIPLFTSLEYHLLIALPLIILSFSLPALWPIVALAAAIPVALSILAARRTVLPPDRTRWWSRPMVALLHYLQPIARGAARHRARLTVPRTTPTPDNSLEATSRVFADPTLGTRAYWSAEWRDRREWVERIVAELERQGWPCRADSGWSDFDLQVYGPRWTRVALTTAAESGRDRSQMLRVRLRREWTLAAHVTFWGTVALLALIIGVFKVDWRGAWVPPAVLFPLAWFLRRQGRNLQAQISVVLDQVARDWNLSPATQQPSDPPPSR